MFSLVNEVSSRIHATWDAGLSRSVLPPGLLSRSIKQKEVELLNKLSPYSALWQDGILEESMAK